MISGCNIINKRRSPVFLVFFGMILTIIIPVKSWSEGGLSFLKEKIIFTVCDQDTIEIQGVYWFSNTDNNKVETTIYYPFPLDSGSAYPYYIKVEQYGSSKTINYRKLSNGIEWRQTVPANGLDSVLVVYRQKVKRGMGQYIVSTTKFWDKPLQKADFKVCIPQSMIMTYWSFQADSISTIRNTIIYHSHFDSFMPDGEMDVRWR